MNGRTPCPATDVDGSRCVRPDHSDDLHLFAGSGDAADYAFADTLARLREALGDKPIEPASSPTMAMIGVAPMSADRLRAVLAESLLHVDHALADADGNQDRSPYNLVTPGGSVVDELLVVAEGLAWMIDALSPPLASPAPSSSGPPAPGG